jgi:hypothetical protein
MFLTKEANVAALRQVATLAALRQVATLAARSTSATTFILPLELTDPEVRPGMELAEKGARASGSPFISFFTRTRSLLWLAKPASCRLVATT